MPTAKQAEPPMTDALCDARCAQPVAAVRRVNLFSSDHALKSALRREGGAAREAAWRNSARAPAARMPRAGPPRQRGHAQLQDPRCQGPPPRYGRVPSRLPRLDGDSVRRPASTAWTIWRARRAAPGANVVRAAALHGGPDGGRPLLPHHHDQCRPVPCSSAPARSASRGEEDPGPPYDRRFCRCSRRRRSRSAWA